MQYAAHACGAVCIMQTACSYDRRILRSIDGATSQEVEYYEPDRYRWLYELGKSCSASHPVIVQGAGLSYVAASFGSNSRVINMRHFNRIVGFSPERAEITVEAGITLQKIFEFLSSRGFYLPVQPGHPLITIGGCIAGDVYGKNQYKQGLFRSCVKEIHLFHPQRGEFVLSREKDPEIFDLTCGGFGLTGIIVSATLHLKRLFSQILSVKRIQVKSLEDTALKMGELADGCDGIYSWNDLACLRGAGFIEIAQFVELEENNPVHPVVLSPSRPRTSIYGIGLVPQRLRFCLLNLGYGAISLCMNSVRSCSLYDFSFPLVSKSWYYSLYGRAGLIEQQILIPPSSVQIYFEGFKKILNNRRPVIGLASCKLFRGNKDLLRFDGTGVVLTFDVPHDARHLLFLQDLDRLNSDCGAFTNLLKDSRISTTTAADQHEGFETFRAKLASFDSARLFRSDLSRRLQL